uniref:Uncharacterized protein n=1 Tax=Glossina brevipalpis TaxID=37001 RepID=A0A1A9W769_9MUSC
MFHGKYIANLGHIYLYMFVLLGHKLYIKLGIPFPFLFFLHHTLYGGGGGGGVLVLLVSENKRFRV